VFSGAILGMGILRKFDSAYQSGRFVWFLPSALFVWVAADSGLRRMFVPPPGDDGIGIALFTMPMLASSGYALGMLANRRVGVRLRREP
jgi:hypothetical protein